MTDGLGNHASTCWVAVDNVIWAKQEFATYGEGCGGVCDRHFFLLGHLVEQISVAPIDSVQIFEVLHAEHAIEGRLVHVLPEGWLALAHFDRAQGLAHEEHVSSVAASDLHEPAQIVLDTPPDRPSAR